METIRTDFNETAAGNYQRLLMVLVFWLISSNDANAVQAKVEKRRLDRRAVQQPQPAPRPVPAPRFG